MKMLLQELLVKSVYHSIPANFLFERMTLTRFAADVISGGSTSGKMGRKHVRDKTVSFTPGNRTRVLRAHKQTKVMPVRVHM
jgi:hypothetical protein